MRAASEALWLAFLLLKAKAKDLTEADEVLFWEHVLTRAQLRLADIAEERAFQAARTVDAKAEEG